MTHLCPALASKTYLHFFPISFKVLYDLPREYYGPALTPVPGAPLEPPVFPYHLDFTDLQYFVEKNPAVIYPVFEAVKHPIPCQPHHPLALVALNLF